MPNDPTLNLTIYTPEGAHRVTVDTAEQGPGNDQSTGLLQAVRLLQAAGLSPSTEAAILIQSDGRVFYISPWGQGHRRITDLFEHIEARFRRAFELLIEQHRLDIVTALRVGGQDAWDAALLPTTVLAEGEQLRYAAEAV